MSEAAREGPTVWNARDGGRTRTPLAGLRILSPMRLPVSPPRPYHTRRPFIARRIFVEFSAITRGVVREDLLPLTCPSRFTSGVPVIRRT